MEVNLKSGMDKKNLKEFTVKVSIIAVIFFILYLAAISVDKIWLFITNFVDILAPFMIGAIIAYLIYPLVNKMEKLFMKKARLNSDIASKIAITLSEIIMLVVVTACACVILPQTISSIEIILDSLPKSTVEVQLLVDKVLSSSKLLDDLLGKHLEDISVVINNIFNNTIVPNMANLLDMLASGVMGSITIALNLIVGLVSSIFFLYHRKSIAKQLTRILKALLGDKLTESIIIEAKLADKTFGGFVVGKIIDSLIIGIIAVITLLIMKIPYATLIGFIIGITNVIPIAGPFIGAVPGAIILLALEPSKVMIFLIFVLILQQIDGNIIGPKCIGSSTGLNAAWVLVSIMIFGGLWGLVGMVIGVPLMSMILNYVNKFTDKAIEKKNEQNTK